MDRILTCIVLEHDWRWTLAAALVCLLGVGGAFALLKHARGLETASRRGLAMAAALIGGSAMFATHFTAMQGYRVGAALRYDVGLTAASYLIVVGAIVLACLLLLSRASRTNRIIAATLGLSGVAAMHFVGVYALELPGVPTWQPGLGALSVLGAVIIAGLSGAIYRPTRLGLAGASIGGALAVIWLHFVAMAAMQITPSAIPTDVEGSVSAGAMTALLGMIVLALAAVGAAIGWVAFLSRSSALARIRQAIDASPDGLAFYDQADRLVLWNQRYAEVNPELVPNLKVGMVFRDIIQIGLEQRLYDDAVGREAVWLTERLASRKSGSAVMEQRIAGDRWLRVMDRRTEAGVVTVCTDITDLKRQAVELVEARDAAQAASTAKTQFLANMSHEIRTPLNGVVGCAQALAATDLTAQQTEMLDLIQSSSRTLQVLLSDILDLARVESGRLELTDDAFDLGAAVREAAQLYEASAREKGLQFFVEVTPEADRWIHGDVVRLKQILTNLVSNAVKFTHQGFVGLTAVAGPDAAGAPTLRFSVEDTGIGFDCETRERLFSRFEQADGAITRRFGGSGLGLAISRQLAEMMGGDLDCESEPGGGSAFILTVPLKAASAPTPVAAPDIETQPTPVRGAVRVLLADDHPINRKVVEMILAQIDVVLTSVEDGAQAVRAVRDGDFDLILMDMQMPVMDGLAATREIRLHEAAMGLPRTPVVMLTANALAEHVAAAQAAGADRHIAKPFDAAELLAVASELPRRAARNAKGAIAA